MEGPDFGLCEGFIRGASDGSAEGCNVGKKLGSSIHGCQVQGENTKIVVCYIAWI